MAAILLSRQSASFRTRNGGFFYVHCHLTLDEHPVQTDYRSIVEHAIEGIFQTTPDGHYLLANPALAAMYGYASVAELKAAVREIARQLYVVPIAPRGVHPLDE